MKKLNILMAIIIALTFTAPALAVNTDAVSGPSLREVKVIGQYLGSFGVEGEKTGILINLYEDNKEAKALIDTYPITENKSKATSKFIASATIEAGGSVKLFGKEILERKDGAQLMNLSFNLKDGIATGEGKYLNSDEVFPLNLVLQEGETRPSDWARTNFYSYIVGGTVPLELQLKPKTSITRGEFAELVVILLLKTENKTLKELEEFSLKEDKQKITFTDTKDDIYISIAARLGIVKGYGDGTYKPDEKITREEAAVLLSNLVNYVTKGNLVVNMMYIVFDDEKDIATWAKSSVQLVSKVGVGGKVMNGVGDKKFDPKGTYTVEQAIFTMQRIEAIAASFGTKK